MALYRDLTAFNRAPSKAQVSDRLPQGQEGVAAK